MMSFIPNGLEDLDTVDSFYCRLEYIGIISHGISVIFD